MRGTAINYTAFIEKIILTYSDTLPYIIRRPRRPTLLTNLRGFGQIATLLLGRLYFWSRTTSSGSKLYRSALRTAPWGIVVAISQGSSRPPPALPEFVVVDIPGYKGDPIFPGAGREKWAPIPPVTVMGKTKKGVSRTAVPLILRWAITITRSHGLTIPECLVNIENKSGQPPLRSPGSAFVAWAREVAMEGWACRMLPPFGRFLDGRFHEHHKLRSTYEVDMDARHESFMRSRGYEPEDEAAAHLAHLRARSIALRDREPTAGEICERLDMVRQRGVLPIPPDVLGRVGNKSSDTVRLADVSRAFRSGGRLEIGASKTDLSRARFPPTSPQFPPR